jgi:serine protease Do
MRVASATLLAALALAAALPAAEPTAPELLAAVEKQLKTASDTAGPCVACVVVSKSDRYPKAAAGADAPGKLGGFDLGAFLKDHPNLKRFALTLDLSDPVTVADHGYACGVVIDPAGLVLTPYHVVEGATKIYVHLPGRGGSYADIRAAESRSDLAVLKLIAPPAGLSAITFGKVRLIDRAGERATVSEGKLTILVASNYFPGFAIDKPAAALGSVANVVTPAPAPNGPPPSESYYHYGPLIAHDAKLNTGIDGAALLNLDGEMIGLTTSSAVIAGGRGPHFALPADEYFRNVVEVLRRGEEVDYGYLGVRGPRPGEAGITFQEVMPRGPAARAGMDERDMLTHVNGYPTRTYEQLLLHIGSALAGSKVRLTLSRNGRRRDVDVTLGKFAHKQPYIASVRPEPVFGLRVDYGSVLAQRLPGGDARASNGVPPGVSVREVAPGSPAAKALGERPERWVITRVNGNEVTTPAEFYKAAKGQRSVKLTILDPTELQPRPREVTLP